MMFCRWLYSLFLAVDANFRLKLKNRKIKDPEIGSGWAYFVENSRYIEHISQSFEDAEVSGHPFLRWLPVPMLASGA